VRHKGKITNWNAERGFGFVTPAGGGERVFLHITAISDRRRPPAEPTLSAIRNVRKDFLQRAGSQTALSIPKPLLPRHVTLLVSE
jgi:cold shock CspA family protein